MRPLEASTARLESIWPKAVDDRETDRSMSSRVIYLGREILQAVAVSERVPIR